MVRVAGRDALLHSLHTVCSRRSGYVEIEMKTVSKMKKLLFVSCTSRAGLLKECVAGRGARRPGGYFFQYEKRMIETNFTRREILEEVSSRKPIHPSIERTE